MNREENNILEKLEAKLNAFIERQNLRDEKTDAIYRALYGDPINQTEGLVARQKADEADRSERQDRDGKIDLLLEGLTIQVSKNTTFRKRATKILYLGGGTVGVGGAGAATFWEHVKSLASKLL